MAHPWDDLPLDTPTRIDETDGTDTTVWATRTENGGTVESRVTEGGPTDLATKETAAEPTVRDLAAKVDALTGVLADKAVLSEKDVIDIGAAVAVAVDAEPAVEANDVKPG